MRATFDNPKGVLFPQQFVNVRLLIDTLKGVALAPNAAVQIGPSGDFVYLLNGDGTVAKRDIVAGPSDGKSTTIKSGLAAGDKVVIDGVDRLRDGAKVTVAAGVADATTPGQSAGARPGGGGSGGDGEGRHRRQGQNAAGSPAPNGAAASSGAQP
jgi:multidrug efflux system membrane fusion protein